MATSETAAAMKNAHRYSPVATYTRPPRMGPKIPATPHASNNKPRFLLSHGRQDPVVPFQSGTHARELLEKHGFAVTWRPFDGGHEIPAPLLAEVERFLFG